MHLISMKHLVFVCSVDASNRVCFYLQVQENDKNKKKVQGLLDSSVHVYIWQFSLLIARKAVHPQCL